MPRLFCIYKIDRSEALRSMGILSDAPQGFASTISFLNALPQGLLAELVSKINHRFAEIF